MTELKLPFELTTDAVTEWLHSLGQLNSANSANHLNNVVKQLRMMATEQQRVLTTLIQLTPTILYIIEDVLSSLSLEKNNEVNRKTQKIKKLCVQLLRNSSLAFLKGASDESVHDEAKNQAVYFALQFVGYTLRLSAIYKELPSLSMWKRIGEIYSLAQQNKCFRQEIKHRIKTFKGLTCIEDVLKRNFLFSMLEPNRYSRHETAELFLFADQYATLLSLNAEKIDGNVFGWDVNGEMPPSVQKYNSQKSQFTVNIDTSALTYFMQSTRFSCQLTKETLQIILNRLSGYKNLINSPVPSLPVIYNSIIGFKDVVGFLEKANKLKKIQQLSLQNTGDLSVADATVDTFEPQKNHLTVAENLAPSNSHSSLLNETKAVKILESKNEQYCIAESNSITCSIGDIILLCTSDLSSQVGIIKQIKVTNTSGTMHLLIEKITGIPLIQQLKIPESPDEKGIYLEKSDAQPELLLLPNKCAKGVTLTSDLQQYFSLGDVIDYSSFYNHHILHEGR